MSFLKQLAPKQLLGPKPGTNGPGDIIKVDTGHQVLQQSISAHTLSGPPGSHIPPPMLNLRGLDCSSLYKPTVLVTCFLYPWVSWLQYLVPCSPHTHTPGSGSHPLGTLPEVPASGCVPTCLSQTLSSTQDPSCSFPFYFFLIQGSLCVVLEVPKFPV